MGDLKKKKKDDTARIEDRNEMLMQSDEMSIDERVMNEFCYYMKLFVEKQMKKQKGAG